MERRKRVEAMMASRIFKEELERIVEHHSRDGGTIFSSQNLSDIFGSGSRMKTGAIIPINDIKGPESLFYIKGEKMLRCKLAALYRLVDLHGWTQNIYNHITVSYFYLIAFFVFVTFYISGSNTRIFLKLVHGNLIIAFFNLIMINWVIQFNLLIFYLTW